MLVAPEPFLERMREALVEAAAAAAHGDVPVGALLLAADGSVLARSRNERELTGDPTAHAEVLALRRGATARGGWNLEGCTLVVTLEPCAMCAGAILAAHVSTVVFGAWDEKAGAAGSRYDLLRDRRLPQACTVYAGVEAEESERMLGDFFRARR